mgnify:CR=1 FL=1
MLVLTRKSGEAIYIGDNIKIVVGDMDRGKVRICIEAPKEVEIRRGELPPQKETDPDAS